MSSQRLLIVSGSGQEKTVNLIEGQEYILGRSETAEISLDDVKASRRHASLKYGQGAWTVQDLDSTNGVFVGNERIHSSLLQPGSVFRIGQTVFSLQQDLPYQSGRTVQAGATKGGRPGWFFPVLGGILILVGCFLAYGVLQQSVSEKKPEESAVGVIVKPPEDITFYAPKKKTDITIDEDEIASLPQASGRQSDKNTAASREHYRMGLLFYDSGHLKKAIDEWDVALAHDSSNSLVIKKLARALKELDYEVGQHYRSGKMHMKYLRFQEAEREFMIVAELARNKDDERVVDSVKQLEIIQNK